MALSALVDIGARPSPSPEAVVELAPAPTDAADEAPDLVRLLADRWIAGLDDRPFRPTSEQLAWVWGGELARGETRQRRARLAGWRYAELFARHVVQDVTVEGGVGAYCRVWLCAQRAFVESVGSSDLDSTASDS